MIGGIRLRNVYIAEAAESLKKIDKIKTSLRKKLNACKLANFKSKTDCSDMFSVFFCNSLPENWIIDSTEWFGIYSDLLSEPKFFENLTLYMGCYQPENYEMLFRGVRNLIDQELDEQKKNRISYLSVSLSSLQQLEAKFNAIYQIATRRYIQPELVKFSKTCISVLSQYQNELTCIMNKEMQEQQDNDPLGVVKYAGRDQISEEAVALLDGLEKLRVLIEDAYCGKPISEGVVSAAKDHANNALVKKRRVIDYMDRTIFKLYDTWRKRKETKNHEQMMGETLKLSVAIKKVFQTFISYQIFGPLGAIITAIVTHAIDQRTEKTDRMKIANDLKDEIEIVNEKIAIAERNNDDKAKIEMIRIRQKLHREYARITKGIYLKEK